MLLLGIETATRRVGVVLASDDGMLARVELGGYADAGAPRHAEQLAPAIEYCCNEIGTSLDHVSAIAVGIGPGLVHRPAGRRDDREGAGAGVARPDDPGAEPRPARVPVAARARARRERDRRPAQRDLLRALPSGARRRAAGVGVRGRLGGRPRDRARSARRGSAVVRRRRALVRQGLPRRRACRARRARARRAEPGRAGGAGGRPVPARGVLRRRRRAAALPAQERRRARPGTGRTADVATARKVMETARGAHHADASSPPAFGAADRGAGVSDAVVARTVRERARAAIDARVRRRASRSRGRRLRGIDDVVQRRAHHDRRGRSRLAARRRLRRACWSRSRGRRSPATRTR